MDQRRQWGINECISRPTFIDHTGISWNPQLGCDLRQSFGLSLAVCRLAEPSMKWALPLRESEWDCDERDGVNLLPQCHLSSVNPRLEKSQRMCACEIYMWIWRGEEWNGIKFVGMSYKYKERRNCCYKRVEKCKWFLFDGDKSGQCYKAGNFGCSWRRGKCK